MAILLVGIGGTLGGLCRFAISNAVKARMAKSGKSFPLGTFIVNMAGSFILGLLVAATVNNGSWYRFLGDGFCGAFTTFSTFMLESNRLIEEGRSKTAVLNLLLSAIPGVILFILGFFLAGAVIV